MSCGQNVLIQGKHATLGTLPLRVRSDGAGGGILASSQQGNTRVITTLGQHDAGAAVAYAANDFVGLQEISGGLNSGVYSALPFRNAVDLAGDSCYITSCVLETDQTTNTSAYRLWLHNNSGSFAMQDNDPFLVPGVIGESGGLMGYIDIPALVPGTNVAWGINATPIRITYKCIGVTYITAFLQTITGFTPVDVQQFRINLGIERG